MAVLALVAGACGDDDDEESTPTTGAAATAAPATTTGATTADTTPDTSVDTTADTSVDTTADTSVDTTADTSVDTTADTSVDTTEDTGDAGGDPLGEPNPASGEPVKLGLITEEGSEAIGSQSLTTIAAYDIGVQYINEYMGGIGGRPIELVNCGNRNTPAGAQDCAQQMVEEDVAAVVVPFDCCGDDQVPIVTGAGIPYVVGSGSAQSHLTAPGAFSLTGGYVAALAAVAQHAADEGFEKVTHVVIDVPSATNAAQQIGGLVFGNAGVEYEVIAAPPGTPDMTAQVSAAGDSAVMVTGDLSFCTSFNQAYDTLGLDNPKYLIATCIDPSVLDTVATAFEGAYLPTGIIDEGGDVELYAAMLEEYGEGDIDPNPYVSGGTASALVTLITFARFMEGLEGEVTAGTVMEQMRTASDVELFLGGGATATCNSEAISILPNVCASGVAMATLNAEGQPTEAVPLDVQPLFTS